MIPMENLQGEIVRQVEENYLKAVLLVHMEKGSASVPDLAKALKLSRSKAYSMASRLMDEGLIYPLKQCGSYKSTGRPLELTPAGKEAAETVLLKYHVIQEWLVRIGIPSEEAEEEACYWEHRITDKMLEALQNQLETADQGQDVTSQLCSILGERKENTGKTTIERMAALLDEYAGAEGLRRRNRLIERAGGVEQLEELLDLVDTIGGFRRLKAEIQIFSRLGEDESEPSESVKQIEKLLDLIDSAGGFRVVKSRMKVFSQMEPELLRRVSNVGRLRETMAVVDALGGVRKIKKDLLRPRKTGRQELRDSMEDQETFAKFMEMADVMGGVNEFVSRMYQHYKRWSPVFQSMESDE